MISERFVLSYKGLEKRVSSIGHAVALAKWNSKGVQDRVIGVLTDENTPCFKYEITRNTLTSEVQKVYDEFLSYI